MAHELNLPEEAVVPFTGDEDHLHPVAEDVVYRRLGIVNVILIGLPNAGDRQWILVDTGIYGTGSRIREAAKDRFGEGSRPAAILLTHGHFDHVGELKPLAEEWDCPVWAHPDEAPYLTGKAVYPPADPGVGGGLTALSSPLLQHGTLDISDRLQLYPETGEVPLLPEWRLIFTPGHAPGHVSFYRERDRLLIAGDAFVTTDQESIYAALTQKPEMHGPPQYLTPNWIQAKESVQKLAQLRPETAITGHGRAVRGPIFRERLETLAAHFDEVAVPDSGRSKDHPLWAKDGSVYFRP